MGDLTGKVLIVSGVSHGIGAAAARLLAEQGATVVLAAHDEPALTAGSSELIVARPTGPARRLAPRAAIARWWRRWGDAAVT